MCRGGGVEDDLLAARGAGVEDEVEERGEVVDELEDGDQPGGEAEAAEAEAGVLGNV